MIDIFKSAVALRNYNTGIEKEKWNKRAIVKATEDCEDAEAEIFSVH